MNRRKFLLNFTGSKQRLGSIFLASSVALLCLALPMAFAQPRMIENGWYEPKLPIPVLHLEGSIETVARAHGKLAASEPHGKDAIHFYGNRLNEYLQNSPALKGHPILQAATRLLYRIFFRNPLLQNTPERYVSAYEGLAKALDEPVSVLWDALVLPDVALRMASLTFRGEVAPLFFPSFGCSSIIWNTGSSSVLHGRNLDYEGAGVWTANPIIMHVLPEEGLAHVAVTTLGIHTPGFTAFNEAGLTLAIHQLTMKDTDSSGTPMPVITAEIMRSARTINDAISILKSFPRTSGWAYVLSQGRDRAVVETSAHELSIRRSSEPIFFQANHVSSPAMQRMQVYYSAGSWLDSQERMKKLIELTPKKALATPKAVVSLLRHRQRLVGATIDKLDNIQSVIFDATRRAVWVQKDDRYYEYRWSDLRSADPPRVSAQTIVIPKAANPAEEKLRAVLKQAHELPLSEYENKFAMLEKEIPLIEKELAAHRLSPGYWGYLYLYALVGLKTQQQEHAKAMLAHLQQAAKDPDLRGNTEFEKHRQAVGSYLRGALNDVLGNREQALLEYFNCNKNTPFERLKKACSYHQLNPFKLTQAPQFQIDWAGVDLMKYP